MVCLLICFSWQGPCGAPHVLPAGSLWVQRPSPAGMAVRHGIPLVGDREGSKPLSLQLGF